MNEDKVARKIKIELDKRIKQAGKNVQNLTKGYWLAMANQAQKVTADRPNKGGNFNGNRNYRPADQPLNVFLYKESGNGLGANLGSVKDYINRHRANKAMSDAVKLRGMRDKKRNVQKAIAKIEIAIDIAVRAEIEAKKPTKNATAKIQRLKAQLEKKKQLLDDANEKLTTKRKPPKKFKFVNRIGSYHGTATPQFNEIYRIGGYPRPKSWGTGNATGGGYYNHYLRHKWSTESDGQMVNTVEIHPGNPMWNNNQRFLRLLEDGGSMMGGPLYEGYGLRFKNVGRITHVTFVRVRRKSKIPVQVKPRRFVKRTIERIRRKLASTNLSTLKPAQWRALGSGSR